VPITGQGWELHIVRTAEQWRGRAGRTVGTYNVYHDGKRRSGAYMSGMVAERYGPGANRPKNNGKRVEAKTYPLATQKGQDYVTLRYKQTESPSARPKPGLLLTLTGDRTGILIHPGNGFLRSIGCLNLCTSLPGANMDITYVSSRSRVIALIEDLKRYLGREFPKDNGMPIPRAFVVIDGEPKRSTAAAGTRGASARPAGPVPLRT
jgi:hypothetical protein